MKYKSRKERTININKWCLDCIHHLIQPKRELGDLRDYCELTDEDVLSSGDACQYYNEW